MAKRATDSTYKDFYEGLTTADAPKYGFFNNWKKSDLIRERVNQLKEMEDYKEKLSLAEQFDNRRASLAESEQLRDLNMSSGHIPMEDEVPGLERDPYTRSAIRQAQSDSAPMLSTANSAVAALGAAPTVGGIAALKGKLDLGTVAKALSTLESGPTGEEVGTYEYNELANKEAQAKLERSLAEQKQRQGYNEASVRADVSGFNRLSTTNPGAATRQQAEDQVATDRAINQGLYGLPQKEALNAAPCYPCCLRSRDNRVRHLCIWFRGRWSRFLVER